MGYCRLQISLIARNSYSEKQWKVKILVCFFFFLWNQFRENNTKICVRKVHLNLSLEVKLLSQKLKRKFPGSWNFITNFKVLHKRRGLLGIYLWEIQIWPGQKNINKIPITHKLKVKWELLKGEQKISNVDWWLYIINLLWTSKLKDRGFAKNLLNFP